MLTVSDFPSGKAKISRQDTLLKLTLQPKLKQEVNTISKLFRQKQRARISEVQQDEVTPIKLDLEQETKYSSYPCALTYTCSVLDPKLVIGELSLLCDSVSWR